MAILDHRGNPVRVTKLTKEIATSSIEEIRQPWFPTVASGLTPERLASLIRAVDQNQIQEYMTLAEEMEERDPHYSSVLRTRKLAVSGLTVQVEATSDDSNEVEVADFVREVAEGEAFSNLIADQLDALGKGYSVSEIMWERSENLWEPSHYEWRDPRFFQFDYKTGRELRLRDEKDLLDGLPLEPYKFVVHYPHLKTGLKIRGGLARLVAVAFMCKGYALKDWLAFAEVFGMPLRVGKYPTNATDEQKRTLLRAVANIGSDAAAIIPDSMIVEFIAANRGTGGEKLFEGLANWLDSQVSKAVLGQTMTTDNGSSMSQAKVHDEVRDDIKLSDAKQLASTLRRDVVKPLVDLNFGPRRKINDYPLLRLVVEEAEDLESLAKSLPPFINLGLQVQESVIRDKFGLPEPEKGALLLGGSKDAEEDEDVVDLEPDDVEEEEEDIEETARRSLLRKLVAGETLTADQRLFLAQSTRDDAVDDLGAEELARWSEQMDPMLEPIIKLAEAATSYEELLKELEGVDLSADELTRVVATLTLKARGLGDGTDKV